MSSWVCKKCGTINKDPLDDPKLISEVLDTIMEKRKEYANKGELYPHRCETCRALRIQD